MMQGIGLFSVPAPPFRFAASGGVFLFSGRPFSEKPRLASNGSSRYNVVMMATLGRWIATAGRPCVWIPAVLLALATALFACSDLDVTLVRPFFSGYVVPRDGGLNEFPLGLVQPWKGMYDWGQLPAFFFGLGGLIVWVLSFVWSRLRRLRDAGLFYALVLIVGPGILINCICKPFWSRPRPHATTAFGVEREFLPVGQRGYQENDSSFPSGHAAMGFYWMAPAFVFWRRRPWLAVGFMALGLSCGTVIGLARMVSGSHFPSDIFWSAGIIYFTALALSVPFRFGEADNRSLTQAR